MLHENRVTVQKTELLEVLKKNRAKHIDEYKAAMLGYRDQLVTELEKKLADAHEDKLVDDHIDVVRPVTHEREYDMVIRMLTMSTSDTVTLTFLQFRNYVEDEWAWTESFRSVTMSYIGRK